MVDVVVLVLVLLVLVKHYFQKGPKRCPILTKFSEIDPWAQTKLFTKKVFEFEDFSQNKFSKIGKMGKIGKKSSEPLSFRVDPCESL